MKWKADVGLKQGVCAGCSGFLMGGFGDSCEDMVGDSGIQGLVECDWGVGTGLN